MHTPSGSTLATTVGFAADFNEFWQEFIFDSRTRDALWNTMQWVLQQITPTDAANCFRHCGYTL